MLNICLLATEFNFERKVRLNDCSLWYYDLVFYVEIICPEPRQPVNGEVEYTKRSVGYPVLYDCLPGYTLRGSRKRLCEMNGYWSGMKPTCQGKEQKVLITSLFDYKIFLCFSCCYRTILCYFYYFSSVLSRVAK